MQPLEGESGMSADDFTSRYTYERDPMAIYTASFGEIDRLCKLDSYDPITRDIATRLVHTCGRPEILDHLQHSGGAGARGMEALAAGAPIITDVEMVLAGMTSYAPLGNEKLCFLNHDPLPEMNNTRTARAVELWKPKLEGAVVAIGNAPTALFHLLDRLHQGWPKPALIIGMPVGFVGAAESKDALINDNPGVPYITLTGREGGSALAAATLNALAFAVSR